MLFSNSVAVQLATLQNLPSDCQAEVDIKKRDGSGDIDFAVCIKKGTCIHVMSVECTLYDLLNS